MLSMLLSGCTRGICKFANNFTYTRPSSEKTYTVVQNGFELNNLKCIYWSTDDDDSCFETEDGRKVFVNGSSIIIEEK